MDFLTLPNDIHCLILVRVHLKSILRLTQTCRTAQFRVLSNVSLWQTLYQRDLSRNLPNCSRELWREIYFTAIRISQGDPYRDAIRHGYEILFQKAVQSWHNETVLPSASDRLGFSTLPLIYKYGRLEMVMMLQTRFSFDLNDWNNCAAYSAEYGHIPLVQYSLDQGVDLKTHRKVLQNAIIERRQAMIDWLLQKEIDFGNQSYVKAAISVENWPLVDLLLGKLPTDITRDLVCRELHKEIKADGKKAIVKILLEHGANPSGEPFVLACKKDRTDVVRLFVHRGFSFAPLDSPIGRPCKHGNLKLVKLLVKAGTDLRVIRNVALRKALVYNQKEVVAYLSEVLLQQNII